jgi:hypothetical protein
MTIRLRWPDHLRWQPPRHEVSPRIESHFRASRHAPMSQLAQALRRGRMEKDSYFYNLDALRGLCAILVALFHSSWISDVRLSSNLVGSGYPA